MGTIKLLTLPIALLGFLSLSAADKDPILIEVGNNAVKLSEFEYLYHKNNQQQLEKESLDDYVDRFVTYKLKVEDAKAAGIDTTASFIKEFNMYRDELAEPYLQDNTVINSLAEEAYERMHYEVLVEHIMLPVVPQYDMQQSVAKLDSIKNCILNGEDFGDLAVKYSIDRNAIHNKGRLGYMTIGMVPYSFEKAAYDTPVGEMAIVRTEAGVHLLRVLDKRPAQGEALVEHILKLYPRNANDSIKAVKANVMDSIYDILRNGADFEEVAKRESEDPGSAAQGGKLPWFGTGRMVPEFEQVAFTLANDSISKPFATQYGIHIVKKLDSRSIPPFDECRKNILRMMKRDERAIMPQQERIKQLKAELGYKENPKFVELVNAEIEKYGKYDSVFIKTLQSNVNCEAFSFADEKVSSSEVLKNLNPKLTISKDGISGYINTVMRNIADEKILSYEINRLGDKHPDFRNLVNEYYDGMMLFEISNRNVWDKANKDTEGLKKYFDEHRDNYKWTEPRYKGYIIYTASDSMANEIRNVINSTERDSLFQTLRKQFKRDIRIEYILAKKGENPVIDELKFGGVKPNSVGRLPIYFEFEGKLIDQPEEMWDVRGLVASDYQNELEAQWVSQLKDKYKVKINKKVLKKVK